MLPVLHAGLGSKAAIVATSVCSVVSALACLHIVAAKQQHRLQRLSDGVWKGFVCRVHNKLPAPGCRSEFAERLEVISFAERDRRRNIGLVMGVGASSACALMPSGHVCKRSSYPGCEQLLRRSLPCLKDECIAYVNAQLLLQVSDMIPA